MPNSAQKAPSKTIPSLTKTVAIDAKFVNAFLSSTIHTLKTQCHHDIQPSKSFILTDPSTIRPDIMGVIALLSPIFNGSVALCLKKATSLTLLNRMMNSAYTDITDEVATGAAKLLDAIFQGAQTELTHLGIKIEKAVPEVLRGNDIKVPSLTADGPTIVVPFKTGNDSFQVLVSLTKSGVSHS